MTEIILDFENLEKKDYNINYDDSIRIIGINFHYPFDIISILLRNNDKSIEKRVKIKNNFFILNIENTTLENYNGLINLLFLDINEFISIQYHSVSKVQPRMTLKTASAPFLASAPGIADNEKTPFEYCLIDGETRQIKMPVSEQLLGVEGDNKAERKYFKCPRYVGNEIDLNTLNLRINWRNAQGDLGTYLVEETLLKDDMIEFYWIIDPKVTAYIGSVDFIVCAVKATPEGTVENKWNTTVAKGNVIVGLPVESPTITESEQDVIAQLLSLLNQKSLESIENIKNEGQKQKQILIDYTNNNINRYVISPDEPVDKNVF